jgi:hypothetical protein
VRRSGFGIAFVLLAAVAALCSSAAVAVTTDAGSWELGAILGEPTGLSAKFWMTRVNALDFGAAWSFEGEGQFHFHCDYLFHNYEAFKVESGSLPVYFGLGGRVRFDESKNRVGLRIVVGLEYLFADYPMSLFFEIAPIVDLAPETEASVNGGVGIRYVF